MAIGFLRYNIAVCALTAFQFGWNSGVINQPRDAITNCVKNPNSCVPMSDLAWGFFVSCFILGGIFGGLIGGYLASKFGRKTTLVWINTLFIGGGIIFLFGHTVLWLFLARLLIGIASGIGTVVVPIYIAELAPIEERGAYGSMNQLSIVVGVLISQLLGLYLAVPEYWQFYLALTGIPSALQAISIRSCIETPRYLALGGFMSDSKECLSSIRQSSVEDEFAELLTSLGLADPNTDAECLLSTQALDSRQSNMPLLEILKSSSLRRPIASAFMLQVAQQMSGINVATFYSKSVFDILYPNEIASALALMLSVMLVLATVLSLFLVDRLGRKTLLITSMGGMSIFSLGIAINDYITASPTLIVICLVLFVVFFGIGLGSIPWLILPELVPVYALSHVSSIATAINWGSCYLIALLTPIGISMFGYQLFFVFAVIMFLMAVFTILVVPETRGRTADEIVNGYHAIDQRED